MYAALKSLKLIGDDLIRVLVGDCCVEMKMKRLKRLAWKIYSVWRILEVGSNWFSKLKPRACSFSILSNFNLLFWFTKAKFGK